MESLINQNLDLQIFPDQMVVSLKCPFTAEWKNKNRTYTGCVSLELDFKSAAEVFPSEVFWDFPSPDFKGSEVEKIALQRNPYLRRDINFWVNEYVAECVLSAVSGVAPSLFTEEFGDLLDVKAVFAPEVLKAWMIYLPCCVNVNQKQNFVDFVLDYKSTLPGAFPKMSMVGIVEGFDDDKEEKLKLLVYKKFLSFVDSYLRKFPIILSFDSDIEKIKLFIFYCMKKKV